MWWDMAVRRPARALPVDSDVDLRVAGQRAELRRAPVAVLGAISLGGGLGGLARYGLDVWFPTAPGGFPWATFGINVSGCLLIGVLMVLVSIGRQPGAAEQAERSSGRKAEGQVWTDQRLLRPFLGVGILGGYTTFSVHILEALRLLELRAVGVAMIYVAGTAVGGLTAAAAGMATARRLVRR